MHLIKAFHPMLRKRDNVPVGCKEYVSLLIGLYVRTMVQFHVLELIFCCGRMYEQFPTLTQVEPENYG